VFKQKTKKECSINLDKITMANIKTIGHYLEYSEADVIKILVSQYFKLQTIEHYDDEGELAAVEYIPFFETKESYEQLKKDYMDEYDATVYPAVMMTRATVE